MSLVLSPRGFLVIGGFVLVLLGVAGFVAPLGKDGILGDFFWLDNGENVAHIVLGVVALAIAGVSAFEPYQRPIVGLLGIVAILAALLGAVGGYGGATDANIFGVANLEEVSDTILHLVVGIWALGAWYMSGRQTAMV